MTAPTAPKARTIHAAVTGGTTRYPQELYAASLDGETWVSTNHDIRQTSTTAEELDALMNPTDGTHPIRLTRAFLEALETTFFTITR